MWKRAIVAALAASLVATPAMAKPRHKHHRHGHHGHYDAHYGHGYGYGLPGYGWYRYGGYRHYRRHHHHHHHNDVFLWLGLTAVGLTTLYVLSQSAQVRYAQAQQQAWQVPVGERIEWSEGAASGSITPVAEGFGEGGAFCREFQREVQIGGRSERAWGIACLQEDGSWRITP